MGLTNEAAYLYVHAKDLVALTRKLRKLSKKAKKHIEKHQKATDEKTRIKHHTKHAKVSKEMRELIDKHNLVIKKLRAHQVAFAHALSKEGSIG